MTPLFARGLCARDAAKYCGISIARLRKYGPPPLPLCPGGPHIWDIRTLDKWMDGSAGQLAAMAGNPAERQMLEALDSHVVR